MIVPPKQSNHDPAFEDGPVLELPEDSRKRQPRVCLACNGRGKVLEGLVAAQEQWRDVLTMVEDRASAAATYTTVSN